MLAKGLAGDELGDRLHLVIDGVDGRTHYVETADSSRLAEIRRGQIVALDPVATKAKPRPSDTNFYAIAEVNGGVYRPSEHLGMIREVSEEQGGDPEAYIRSHVRRLEALRRAGHVERIDADHWRIPKDILERGMAAALDRRAERLVEMGHATVKDGFISIPRRTVAVLERQEVERVGKEMAAERGLTYAPSRPGGYVSGRLAGVANLAGGRFAMIEDVLGFQLVPWQPVLEKRLDHYISGIRRDDWSIDWDFSRKRQIGLGL